MILATHVVANVMKMSTTVPRDQAGLEADGKYASWRRANSPDSESDRDVSQGTLVSTLGPQTVVEAAHDR